MMKQSAFFTTKFLMMMMFVVLPLLGQNPTTETVTFSAPTITASTFTACGGTPFDATKTVEYTFTTWGCGGIRLSSGTTSLKGTGYCSGIGAYCAVSVGGPIAPHFIPEWTTNSTSFIIYVVSQNITDGNLAWGYGCGINHNTQNTEQTRSRPTCTSSTSPIILDTRDVGFHLTDLEHGTVLAGVQTSWTDPRYGNGWLVKPGADGSWESMNFAENFFGNLSPQPASMHPNGYLALQYFASQKGCGVDLDDHLDAANCPAVWTLVRVWIDNGDGIVQPGELHTLDSLGYTSISLKYHQTGYVDQYGNRFRYSALVQDGVQGKERERSFDVFLVTK